MGRKGAPLTIVRCGRHLSAPTPLAPHSDVGGHPKRQANAPRHHVRRPQHCDRVLAAWLIIVGSNAMPIGILDIARHKPTADGVALVAGAVAVVLVVVVASAVVVVVVVCRKQ